MKKVLLIIIAFITIVVSANAQSLTEVRGVETKKEHVYLKGTKVRSGYEVLYDAALFNEGFIFTNQNDFSVSVEAFLFNDGNEVDSKSFELAPKESYFWCTRPEYYREWDKDRGSRFDLRPSPGGYVKYKAYRSNAIPKE